MRVLSLWQPWAEFVAQGIKKIETRSWPTNYRGKLLIHAGKNEQYLPMRKVGSPQSAERRNIGRDAVRAAGMQYDTHFELGAIIAVCELVACCAVTNCKNENGQRLLANGLETPVQDREYQLGNYEPGHYAWLLSNVRKLTKPIPCKGMQRLFNYPDDKWDLMDGLK